jgi:hypothetical protein
MLQLTATVIATLNLCTLLKAKKAIEKKQVKAASAIESKRNRKRRIPNTKH